MGDGRAKELMRLVPLGLMDKEIGDRLGVTEKTINGYLANIYCELGISPPNCRVKFAVYSVLGYILQEEA